MDRALTWFINLWVGFALFLMIVDIFWIVAHAPSLWSGILAAQEKWFDPFNFVHFISEIVFLSPALGAYLWRERRRSREQSSLTAKTIILRVMVITPLLAVVVLITGTLLISALRDRMFSFNMEKLDSWVKTGGSASTLQTEVIETCSNLVLSQAGALERLELVFIFRDELDFRIDVCAKMTANRLYKQPEFEKPDIVNMICDDPKPFHELFRRLCSRSGLRP